MNALVPVAWAGSPFGAYLGDVHRAVRPAGMSLADIVASLPVPPGFDRVGIVCVNGEPVPRMMWPRVRPRPDGPVPVNITLHFPLHGGGGGGSRKNVFGLVASVALLAATTAISAGALGPAGLGVAGGLFAQGSVSAAVLAGGVGIVGALAIAALSPPPAVRQQPDRDDPPGAAGLSGNVLAPGASIPRVVGTMRVTPPLAARPLIEIVDDDEFVEAVYCLAGPHALANVRVDGVPVSGVDDVEIETREGWPDDEALTLVTRQGFQDAPNVTLSAHKVSSEDKRVLLDQAEPERSLPVWHPVGLRHEPDEIWLHLLFPEGLFFPPNSDRVVTVPIRVRFRLIGTETWHHLPEFHYASDEPRAFRQAIVFKWGDTPDRVDPKTLEAAYFAIIETPAQTADPASPAWEAHAHFDNGTGTNKHMKPGTFSEAASRVHNFTMHQDRIEVILAEGTFPKGQYEIQVKRGFAFRRNDFSENDNYLIESVVRDPFWYHTVSGEHRIQTNKKQIQDTVMLTRFASVWHDHPIAAPGLALIAVKARNRSVSQLSVEASGYVQDLSAGAWQAWTTTSNPAPHMRDALVGTATTRPLSTSLLDDDGFSAFRQHAIDGSHECNALFDGRSLEDALSIMAGAAFGRPYKSERWGVIIDRDRSADAPVQVFSPRNMAGFRWERAFADVPHGMVASFRDAARDYNEEQVIVYRDGFSAANATHLEVVTYQGLVTSAEVEARAAFDLAQAVARATFYHGTAPVEALVARRGDLVGVQHDTIDVEAGFARVRSKVTDAGNVTGLILDSVVPVKAGADFFGHVDLFTVNDVFDDAAQSGAMIRLKDGTIIVHEIDGDVGETDEIDFETPFVDPGAALGPDCLVVTGALGSEARRLLVHGVRPGPDLTAQITFVDEAPGLFAE